MVVKNVVEKLPSQRKVFDFRYKQEIDLEDETIRYEQIGYTIFAMATPSFEHERLIVKLLKQLEDYLEDKSCKVLGSNIGVNLDKFIPQLKELFSVKEYFEKQKGRFKDERVFLLSDISIQCEKDGKYQSTPFGYPKVPEMVIEVSSPSNWRDDIGYKKDIYELIGVPEYWVIHNKQNISVYLLKDGKYVSEDYKVTDDDILEVPVFSFPDLVIKFDV